MAEENIKSLLKEHQKEIKRHISVLKEDFDQKLGIIAEQHESIITKLDSHTEAMAAVKEGAEAIKMNIEFILV